MGDRLKIMLVDDDDAVLGVLVAALERFGYQCKSYNDPEQARNVLKSEEFDIVITDYRMPGTTGLDILAQAKKSNPKVKVIFLTAYADLYNLQAALGYGLDMFLLKPLSVHELDKTIRRLQNGPDYGEILPTGNRGDVSH